MTEISVLTLAKYVDLPTRRKLIVKLIANCNGKTRQTEHVVYRSGGWWSRTDDIKYFTATEIMRAYDEFETKAKSNKRIIMDDWNLLREIVKKEIKLTLKDKK